MQTSVCESWLWTCATGLTSGLGGSTQAVRRSCGNGLAPAMLHGGLQRHRALVLAKAMRGPARLRTA
eukprot:7032868-Alexandrium_andersonii.AAC.1